MLMFLLITHYRLHIRHFVEYLDSINLIFHTLSTPFGYFVEYLITYLLETYIILYIRKEKAEKFT